LIRLLHGHVYTQVCLFEHWVKRQYIAVSSQYVKTIMSSLLLCIRFSLCHVSK